MILKNTTFVTKNETGEQFLFVIHQLPNRDKIIDLIAYSPDNGKVFFELELERDKSLIFHLDSQVKVKNPHLFQPFSEGVIIISGVLEISFGKKKFKLGLEQLNKINLVTLDSANSNQYA